MTDLPESGTFLAISPVGVPLYTARKCTQTLTPIQEAKPAPRRTITGQAVWIGLDAMQKFDSEITCTDQQSPPIDELWPGTVIVVDCITTLSYKTISGTPSRTVVSGSEYVVGDRTYYRPRMTFMVKDPDMSSDEYTHDVAWKLGLTEV